MGGTEGGREGGRVKNVQFFRWSPISLFTLLIILSLGAGQPSSSDCTRCLISISKFFFFIIPAGCGDCLAFKH